jgi:DNA-binding response OmpR family regulator
VSEPARRVLVAEDDQDVRDLVVVTLTRAGLQVLVAADGVEALGIALEQAPDLAVLDVSMPRMDGLEVTRRIRGDERARGMPVLFLTASVSEEDARRGIAAGATVVMAKPFVPAELVRRVRALLAGNPEGGGEDAPGAAGP